MKRLSGKPFICELRSFIRSGMAVLFLTMNKYYDYFKEQEHDSADEVTMDEFIAEAMRTDLKFNTLAEELQYQRTSRITLMNELLTCYQYLKDHDMLLLYEAYRNGEELPFD